MRRTWQSWLVLGVAAALIAAAPAGAEPPSPMAITAADGVFTVTPLVPYEHLSLRVATPDGRNFEVEASAGPVSFRPFEIVGYRPVDGTYVWQVLLTPRGAIDRELHERALRARESGDVAAEQALRVALSRAIVVRSGGFGVLAGKLLFAGAAEPKAVPKGGQSRGARLSPFAPASLSGDEVVPADQVFADDVIVQNSLCVGFDCVNGEVFGFDTIRLKENNTRIKFDDTSTSAGFPNTDWQLTANDSASGGQNKFSIEDTSHGRVPFTVEASSPTNSLYVDSTGRIGFRTSTPVLDIHVATSNTPGVRLEQNSSGGFSAQSWDVAGNETNFFVRDVTGGSLLPFRIRPGAPTSSIDISASGDVGVGTASPQNKLDIRGSSATADTFASMGVDPNTGPSFNFGYAGGSVGRSAGFFNIRPDASATAPNPSIRFFTANVQRLIVDNEGFVGLGDSTFNPTSPIHHQATGAILSAAGIWTNGSSREIKQDIVSLGSDEAKATLVALAPIKYASKIEPTERHVGFIAEDVPDLVASNDRKTLSPMDIVAVLTRVVQDQQRTVEEQKKLIEELAAKIAALEAARPR